MTERFPGPQALLACERCHRRKVKCNKRTPCSNCERFGVPCIPVRRARYPRGRMNQSGTGKTTQSESGLSDRVNKLEQQLLELATGDRSVSNDLLDPVNPQPSANRAPESEVAEPLSSLETDQGVSKEPQETSNSAFGLSLALSPSSHRDPSTEKQSSGTKLPPQTCRDLAAIYFYNVDPLFKILHRPSVQKFLYDGQQYLKYGPHDHAPSTLASAIYYSAVCSMDESQYGSIFSKPREIIIAQLQRETEAALLKADCTTSNDLTILQAFVLFLLATWTHDRSRRVWTMLSMALRMAQALSLHMAEPPFETTPFEQEMRKRLWLAIGLLDVSASLSQATEPMMQAAWLESHPPSNINDDDIWCDMEKPPESREETVFTDMSFSLLVFEAQNTSRSIGFSGWAQVVIENPSIRQQLIHRFRNTVSRLLVRCRPELEAFHWYAKLSALTMNSWLQLISIRPLRASKDFVSPAIPGDGVLRLAAENIQAIIEGHNDPRVSPWRWFDCMWTPWHGLAVAMAELCACNDLSIMERYWPLVENVYIESRHSLNDSGGCRVRKPMEKLFVQAQTRRKDILQQHGMSEIATEDGLSVTSNTLSDPRLFTSASLELESFPISAHQIETSDNTLEPVNFLDLGPNIWDQVNFDAIPIENDLNMPWQSYEDFIVGFQNAS